ncbi:MAG: undecaprenyldiphospho-muramoylpentapeptide beta-N-acetylglucosaminyltransferase [Propionibacteriaceae bacterium]|jgi:UDP-N-acetylglucosamine--N-acetylmuramyl-(pentapeptide) pyrophosphoryl-undecaprenol N-acetylglucosamine transferase|nr:undecaprenyldiphospho-muramoylpentapeptide beta-N-acetylglucosaminyltransferase [Propionibacteriaceae bacterium]
MRVVLAGGGTTGHISPLLATAAALRLADPAGEIVCVGTPAGLETTLVPAAGYDLRLVDPVPLPRRVSAGLVTLPFRIVTSVRQAGAVLRDARADVVVGFGGYASLPVFLAARRAAIPVVVHEANAVPGLANRIAARFAARTCVAFANTGLKNQVVVGTPVRRGVADLDRGAARPAARTRFGLPVGAPVLLVSGGSQGARSLNRAVTGALPGLDAAGISVLHVTGPKNFEEPVELPLLTRSTYVRLPYVAAMEDAYAAADLMLARAGAATVTETALVGLPALFVPLPHGNGEQAKNAAGVVAAGGGLLIADADLTPDRLVAEASRVFADPAVLARMSVAARGVMPGDAAERVAAYALQAGGRQ